MRALRAISGARRERGERGEMADPADYAGLLTQLSDPEVRTTHLKRHLEGWLDLDRTAVRDWIGANAGALPPEMAVELLRRAGGTP